ncbi:MAG: hypothetical protein ACRYGO_22495 [Janthinobacterium lividum]
MARLLSNLLRFLQGQLFAFALIVLVLVALPWISGEWENVRRIAHEPPKLNAALQEVGARQAALLDALTRQVRQLSGAPLDRLDAHIRVLDQEIRDLQAQRTEGVLADAMRGPDAVAARLKAAALREVNIEARRQARDHLLVLRAQAVVMADRKAAQQRLGALRQAHLDAYAAYQRTHRQVLQLRKEAGWLARIPYTPQYARLRALEQEEAALVRANNRAHRQFLAQQALLERLPALDPAAAFRIDEARLASATAALRERLAEAERLAASNLAWRAYAAVRPVLPAAFGVLLGWWLLPVAMRSVFYFVLAPLAARRPPIVIGKAGHAVATAATAATAAEAADEPRPDGDRARIFARLSAVSLQVSLGPGEEMLIRPDYCQSQPVHVRADTKLLFDWRHCLTSIAAHLWMLKRLRSSRDAGIVVSATADQLDEVALLELAPGEAFVLQPRALVGVVHGEGRRPAIRAHWRLGTLHAWLTLQLRYLAFEGPATLVVKGCRGVRLEAAAAGRTISQEATLGFSANARYGTVRAEPFLPYLQGVQPLFHDKFEGPDAWYLYEEVPRNAVRGRRRYDPFGVLVDAGLKAFGI